MLHEEMVAHQGHERPRLVLNAVIRQTDVCREVIPEKFFFLIGEQVDMALRLWQKFSLETLQKLRPEHLVATGHDIEYADFRKLVHKRGLMVIL